MRIRRVLDYRQEPEYTRLADAVAGEGSNPVADELYRYLNFFELLASLATLKQLKSEEILKLFEYDLKLIKESRFVMNALRPQRFEHPEFAGDNRLQTWLWPSLCSSTAR